MTWLWRTLLNSLLTNLRRKENMLRELWSCRTNKVAESSFKRRSRNWTMMSESVLNTEWVCITLGKSVNQPLLELHTVVPDKNNPHLCDFMETHYLNEEVKSIKDLRDHLTNLCKRGGSLNLARQRLSLTSTPLEAMMAELSLRP